MHTKSAPDLALASPNTDGVRESNSHARGPVVVVLHYYPRQEARKASEAAGTRHCGKQARRDEEALLVRAAGVQGHRMAGRERGGKVVSEKDDAGASKGERAGLEDDWASAAFIVHRKGKCRRRAATG